MNADAKNLAARMRVAVARLKLLQADIEEIGVALTTGRIDAKGALYWIECNGVADLLLTDGEVANVSNSEQEASAA